MWTFEGRLDHIFHDARLTPTRAAVLPLGRSDHLPVTTTFIRAPSR